VDLGVQSEWIERWEVPVSLEPQVRDRTTGRNLSGAEFSEMAELLAKLDIEEIWQVATPEEQRRLACELIEYVRLYPDRLRVQVAGAPEFTVNRERRG